MSFSSLKRLFVLTILKLCAIHVLLKFQSICNKFVFLILFNLPNQAYFSSVYSLSSFIPVVLVTSCRSTHSLFIFCHGSPTSYHCILNVTFWVACTYCSIISAVMPWFKNNYTFSHCKLRKWIGYRMNNWGSVTSFLSTVWQKQRYKRQITCEANFSHIYRQVTKPF
jgi:hypothetical protein